MPERLDRITVALDRLDVVLSWKARTALLDRLETGQGVRSAFEAVGATRPVTLTLPQKAELLLAIEQWAKQTPGGFIALPDGIFDLREGLHNDLRDAGGSRGGRAASELGRLGLGTPESPGRSPGSPRFAIR